MRSEITINFSILKPFRLKKKNEIENCALKVRHKTFGAQFKVLLSLPGHFTTLAVAVVPSV